MNSLFRGQAVSCCLTMLALLLGYADLSAQPHESLYGTMQNVQKAMKNTSEVVHCNGGGDVAVGIDYGPGYSDIYVVRTNPNGTPIWERTYSIGTMDEGHSIVAVPGGFAVTGWTDVNGFHDAFIMVIGCEGEVIWARTYGTQEYDEEGLDIAVRNYLGEMRLYVVGTATDAGGLAGMILATNANGTIYNMERYDVPGYAYVTFNSVIVHENNQNFPSQLVIAGSAYSQADQYQGLMVQTFEPDGLASQGPVVGQWVAVVGFPQNEFLYSVIERKSASAGNRRGNYVFVGETNSIGLWGDRNVYLIEMSGTESCAYVNDSWFGNRPAVFDEPSSEVGYDLVEALRYVPHVTHGDILVTGHTNVLNLFVRDAFIQPVDMNLVPRVNGGHIYGNRGPGLEAGHSIGETANGYVVGGEALQHPNDPADNSDFYIFRTNMGLGTCCDTTWNPDHESPAFPYTCEDLESYRIGEDHVKEVTVSTWETYIMACTIVCPMPKQRPEQSQELEPQTEPSVMFPNPVAKGQMVTVVVGNAVAGTGRLTVTDINGRIVHEQSFASVDGVLRLQFGTASLVPASYVATVDIGGRISRMSFVIGE